MSGRMILAVILAVAVILSVSVLHAATYTWVDQGWYDTPNNGNPYPNWTTSSDWTGGAGQYPGVGDTAVFNLSGGVYTSGGWVYYDAPRCPNLDTSETVAAVQISGSVLYEFQNASTTLTTGSFTVTDTGHYYSENWIEFDPILAGAAPTIDEGELELTNPNNSFTGTIDVNGGALVVSNNEGCLGGASNAIDLGSANRIGGFGAAGNDPWHTGITWTNSITLSGIGGAMVGHDEGAQIWGGTVSGSGVLIVDTSTGTVCNYSDTRSQLTGNNTYSGGTIVASGGIQAAATTVPGTYGYGTGNVVIRGSGLLSISDATNLAPGATVLVDNVDPNGGLYFLSPVMPNIDPASSGTLHFAGGSGGGFDPQDNDPVGMALQGTAPIGNGQMFLGIQNGWYQGDSLAALVANDPTHTYKLGDCDQAYTSFQRMIVGGEQNTVAGGDLRDLTSAPYNLQIGRSGVWSEAESENIVLVDANTYSGTTTVNFNNALVAETNWNGGGGTGLGIAGGVNSGPGNIVLNGEGTAFSSYGNTNYASLEIVANGSTTLMVNKGNLSFTSASGVALDGNSTSMAQMTVASLTRSNNGTLGVVAVNGNMGNGENLLVAGGLTPVNGMVSAYYWDMGDNEFLTYNASGFARTTAQLTSLAAAAVQGDGGASSIVYTGNDTVASGGQTVYALKTTGVISSGVNDVLTVGDGTNPAGVIFAGGGTQTANFAFGGSEGIIYTPANTTINGTISGSNGITKSGMGNLTLGGANTGLSGQVTVNQGTLTIAANNNLGAGNVYLNGGGLNFNPALSNNVPGGFCTTNIILGPSGGWLNLSQTIFNYGNPGAGGQGGGTLPSSTGFSGNITGSGALYVTSNYLAVNGDGGNGGQDNNNWVCLLGTGNTYTGGTYVTGSNIRLKVGSGSSLGTGDLIVGTSGGSAEVNSNVVDIMGNTNLGRVYLQQDASVVAFGGTTSSGGVNDIGSLEGVGWVLLGQMADIYPEWNGTNTLTVGTNNLSTDYFGRIIDALSIYADSLTKVGTGTLTLWGENTYGGTTTVNNGTLVNNNLISGTVAVTSVSGSTPTYSGTGTTLGRVTVRPGGTVAGSGLLSNGLTVDGGTVNMNGAKISGTLYDGYIGTAATGSSVTLANSTVTSTLEVGYSASIAYYATFTGTNDTLNGTVVVYHGSTFTGTNETINAGVTVGNTFTLGGPATFTGTNTVNDPGGNVTIENGTISGSNNITVANLNINTGANVALCTLSGSNTVTGTTNLSTSYPGSTNALVTGNNTFNGNVNIYGGTFQGPNTVNGNLTTETGSNAVLAPSADSVSAHTLTVVGAVTLDHSTTLDFNLGTPGTIGGGINDLITITGSLSLDGTLNVTGLTGFGAGTYTLFTYTGLLTEPSGPLTLGTMPPGGYNYTIDTSTTGQVNLDVVTPWQPGDTNHDGLLNSLDIDAIYHNFGAPSTSQWKVDGDGNVVGQGDVTYELHTYFHTNYGDANLDTKTDFSDFQVLLDHWQVSGPTIGWAQGDFNGSYSVDFLDFQTLLDYWNPGGWSFAPAQTPEPATLTLLALGGLALLRRSRKA